MSSKLNPPLFLDYCSNFFDILRSEEDEPMVKQESEYTDEEENDTEMGKVTKFFYFPPYNDGLYALVLPCRSVCKGWACV